MGFFSLSQPKIKDTVGPRFACVNMLLETVISVFGIEHPQKRAEELFPEKEISVSPAGHIVVKKDTDTTDVNRFFEALLFDLSKTFGNEYVDHILRTIYRTLLAKYGDKRAQEILSCIPGNFLEEERLGFLPKEQLEEMVRQKTKELRDANSVLEERVHIRTEQLEKLLFKTQQLTDSILKKDQELTSANKELQTLDGVKNEFVSVAAHQLRTPLSGVKWTLASILKGDMGPLTKEQHEFLEKCYDSNDRMIDLVNNMLSVDRIKSGKFEYKIASYSLSSILEPVLFDIHTEAQKRRITVDAKIEPHLPNIECDKDKIRAVLQNFLENAIRYNKEHGYIWLAVRKKTGDGGHYVEISIKDTGIGIPKDEQTHIFKRFYRATNAVSTIADGSGLGLFIAKSIIERHGGKLWFESEHRKGTTFYFTLPITQNGHK